MLSPFLQTFPVVGATTHYSLRDDDCVAVLVVLGFLGVAWVMSHSFDHFVQGFRGLFQTTSHSRRSHNFVNQENHQRFTIIGLASLVMGLWLTTCLWHTDTSWCVNQPTALLPLITIAGSCAYYVVCSLAYVGVNSVFFADRQSDSWSKAYLFSLLIEAVLLFPIVLVAIYAQLPFNWLAICSGIVLVIVGIIRLIHLKSIFFSGTIGYMHIFLYFCTLNLAPAFLAWRILTQINHSVTL